MTEELIFSLFLKTDTNTNSNTNLNLNLMIDLGPFVLNNPLLLSLILSKFKSIFKPKFEHFQKILNKDSFKILRNYTKDNPLDRVVIKNFDYNIQRETLIWILESLRDISYKVILTKADAKLFLLKCVPLNLIQNLGLNFKGVQYALFTTSFELIEFAINNGYKISQEEINLLPAIQAKFIYQCVLRQAISNGKYIRGNLVDAYVKVSFT